MVSELRRMTNGCHWRPVATQTLASVVRVDFSKDGDESANDTTLNFDLVDKRFVKAADTQA